MGQVDSVSVHTVNSPVRGKRDVIRRRKNPKGRKKKAIFGEVDPTMRFGHKSRDVSIDASRQGWEVRDNSNSSWKGRGIAQGGRGMLMSRGASLLPGDFIAAGARVGKGKGGQRWVKCVLHNDSKGKKRERFADREKRKKEEPPQDY